MVNPAGVVEVTCVGRRAVGQGGLAGSQPQVGPPDGDPGAPVAARAGQRGHGPPGFRRARSGYGDGKRVKNVFLAGAHHRTRQI